MSKQEEFNRPGEIDDEARISKEAEKKRKFNRYQKRITPLDIQLSTLTFLVLKQNPNNSILRFSNIKQTRGTI